jgi:hypothetical protein
MDLIFALIAFILFTASSRGIFRYLVRRDALMIRDRKCSHGYELLDRGKSCHGKSPVTNLSAAIVAMGMSLVFPVTLAFIAIMYRAPQGQLEMQTRIKELEKWNKEYEREQEQKSKV